MTELGSLEAKLEGLCILHNGRGVDIFLKQIDPMFIIDDDDWSPNDRLYVSDYCENF
jgi:hypothetical protein